MVQILARQIYANEASIFYRDVVIYIPFRWKSGVRKLKRWVSVYLSILFLYLSISYCQSATICDSMVLAIAVHSLDMYSL